ncbi:MAG: helix-turn-helix domain-containing protein [bacterium]
MQPSFNWLAILLLVGAAHGVLLAITLLNIRRGNRVANRIFALILMVFALSIGLHTFSHTQHLFKYPHFSKIEPALVFLFGPLFYFSVKLFHSLLAHYSFSPTFETGSIIWLLVSINMYLIGYMGLRKPEVFSGIENGFLLNPTASQKKYEKSTLTPEKAEEYLEKLRQFMAAQKPYLMSDLTLPGLAKQLSISIHHLSRIINEKLQQNFFEYINSHRVEEAKKRIADPANEHINIAEIGFEVGFNSISSFNAAFKKHAGMTPSQFRERSTNLQRFP